MDKIIEIKNLTKTVKGHDILKNINLEITEPNVYGIIGRNGSGKSVLFKSIAGLLSPTTGEIRVFGENIGKGHLPKQFGALLDTPVFLPHYTGFKNLKLLSSIKNEISDERLKEVITSVGLDPNDRRPVRKYSMGMRQRLGIAQAIMAKPRLLILDEPMNGLDESGVQDIRDMIIKFKNEGLTILLSSHNSEDIAMLCETVYRIDNGMLTELENDKTAKVSN